MSILTGVHLTWEETLSNLLSNMPDVIDNPNEHLFQNSYWNHGYKTKTQVDVANTEMEHFASIYFITN